MASRSRSRPRRHPGGRPQPRAATTDLRGPRGVRRGRADHRSRAGGGGVPPRRRPAPRELRLLRRARGNPHRLGARHARGRRRPDRAGRADRRRDRVRRSGSRPAGRSSLMAQLTAEAAQRSPAVRRTVFWTLGLGAFGLAFSITTTAAYLPPHLRHFTDSGTLIGLILGAEGIFALLLSPVIGPWSDTFHTPLGRRRPFMLAALGPLGF